jgi:hypothetical protein
VLLANVFAIYIKANNFPWHFRGPDFRDYHLLLDEPAEQVLAMTSDIAQRVRKVGEAMVRSIGHVAGLQHVADKGAEYMEPGDTIGGLSEGKQALIPRRIETRRRGKRRRNCQPVGELDRPRGVSNVVPVLDESDSGSRLDLIAQHLSIFALWGCSGFQSGKRQPNPSCVLGLRRNRRQFRNEGWISFGPRFGSEENAS